MFGECVISSLLSCCSKNLKQQTDQCYSLVLLGKTKDSTPSRSERRPTQNTRREENPAAQFWLLFLYVFFLIHLGLSYVNWASQECCLFYLRSSLQSLDFPLFYFCRLFPSLSFSHHHSGLLFPILTT